MRIWSKFPLRPRVVLTMTACALAGSLFLGACSSGAAPGARSGTSTSNTITANWTAFFKGSTSAAKKESLLQNGSQFASYIKSQENTSIARSTSVKVTKVKVTSKTAATVTYTIYLNDSPQLAGSKGQAVLQSGTWKVSDTSFCALISLEGANVKACAGK